jgi:serine/threonine protein kinase
MEEVPGDRGPLTFDTFTMQLAAAPPVQHALFLTMGDVIESRYELVALLGEGGFGIVYEAWDKKMDRPVALKLLKKRGESDPQVLREKLAARLGSETDHIVTLYDVGVHAGFAFLVMELLQGQTLQDLLDRQRQLSAVEALAISLQIARGLCAAHASGVIHRDLKPANVFLQNGTRVKLLDFGLAHSLQQGDSAPHGGTRIFASPEQARGEPPDRRSDVFSAAMVLYVSLTGGVPLKFTGTKILTQPPSAAEVNRLEVPRRMRRLILDGVSSDITARPDATQWTERLERLIPSVRRYVRLQQLGIRPGSALFQFALMTAFTVTVAGYLSLSSRFPSLPLTPPPSSSPAPSEPLAITSRPATMSQPPTDLAATPSEPKVAELKAAEPSAAELEAAERKAAQVNAAALRAARAKADAEANAQRIHAEEELRRKEQERNRAIESGCGRAWQKCCDSCKSTPFQDSCKSQCDAQIEGCCLQSTNADSCSSHPTCL